MQIGMISLCYKPLVNGVTQMIDLYCDHLEKRGHQVTIFAFGPKGQTPPDKHVIYMGGIPLGRSGYYAQWWLDQNRQHLIGQMDILHTHHLFITIWLAKVYGNCPVVYTNHTRYDLYMARLLSLPQTTIDPVMRRIWPHRCSYADMIIAPSLSASRILAEFNIVDNVEIIENGIDQRPFLTPPLPLSKTALGLPETAVLLTYVGRLSKEKNIYDLLYQFSIISKRLAHAHLMLIGDGPQRASLEKITQQLGISHKVLFCGQIAHQDIPNYLAASDIFVTASTSEIHPLTLLEAMSAGLPIIAPYSPGNQDIVEHEVTGLLIKSINDNLVQGNTLSQGMERLIMDSALRLQMGNMARSKSKKYNITQTVDKTVALYKRLLNRA
jgi:glycosyltransferase involved in cell wall biosynthesis